MSDIETDNMEYAAYLEAGPNFNGYARLEIGGVYFRIQATPTEENRKAVYCITHAAVSRTYFSEVLAREVAK